LLASKQGFLPTIWRLRDRRSHSAASIKNTVLFRNNEGILGRWTGISNISYTHEFQLGKEDTITAADVLLAVTTLKVWGGYRLRWNPT